MINKVKIPIDFKVLYTLWIIAPLVILKLWFFEYKEKWKVYVSEFEAWPSDKRKKWDWIMRIIIFAIIANLILGFYIMGQIDWSQYR